MTRTIQTTLGEVADAEPALQRVLTIALDAKTRYHAVKLAKMVTAEARHFDEEKNAAIKEFGVDRDATEAEKKRGMTGPITEVKPENLAAFLERIKELRAVAVSLPWGPLTTAMLEPYPAVTGRDCVDLGPLYELDPEPASEAPAA